MDAVAWALTALCGLEAIGLLAMAWQADSGADSHGSGQPVALGEYGDDRG